MKKNKKGFTLIELLAVIVILGIIITIVVSNVVKYISQSKQGAFKDAVGVFIKNTQTQVLASDISGIGSMTTCTKNSECKSKYQYDTANMDITVSQNTGKNYKIVITGIGGFNNVDMAETDKYGNKKYCPKEAAECTKNGVITLYMNSDAEIKEAE